MSRFTGIGGVVCRRAALAGLGALLGLGAPPSRVDAGPSVNLKLGESNTPWNPQTTTLAGGAPSLRVTPDPVGRGLEAKGGPGDKVLWEEDEGGTGIVAYGGAIGGRPDLVGGTAAVAVGGTATNGHGGSGLFAWGGSGSGQAIGGEGMHAAGTPAIVARGGNSKQQGESNLWGGEGIRAFSGSGSKTDPNTRSAGIAAFGGDAFTKQRAGIGVYARGWVRAKGQPRSLGVHGFGGEKGHGVFGAADAPDTPAILAESKSTAPAARGECLAGVGEGIFARNVGSGPGGRFASASGPAVQAFGKTTAIQAESTTGPAISATSLAGAAVVGQSTASAGVAATSATSKGAYFETTSATAAAVQATHALATTTSGVTGLFVNGDCKVTNGVKPMAFQISLGKVLLYAVEATVSVFEDIGEVRLQNGRARVDLDPLFAETIETDEFQVLLTPRGDTRGVFLAARDASGFEIREQAGGTSSVDVNYRIVARRKGFSPAERLERYEPPTPPAQPKISPATRPTLHFPKKRLPMRAPGESDPPSTGRST